MGYRSEPEVASRAGWRKADRARVVTPSGKRTSQDGSTKSGWSARHVQPCTGLAPLGRFVPTPGSSRWSARPSPSSLPLPGTMEGRSQPIAAGYDPVTVAGRPNSFALSQSPGTLRFGSTVDPEAIRGMT